MQHNTAMARPERKSTTRFRLGIKPKAFRFFLAKTHRISHDIASSTSIPVMAFVFWLKILNVLCPAAGILHSRLTTFAPMQNSVENLLAKFKIDSLNAMQEEAINAINTNDDVIL